MNSRSIEALEVRMIGVRINLTNPGSCLAVEPFFPGCIDFAKKQNVFIEATLLL
jgi:hypothetical protein